MIILFCDSGFSRKEVDFMYEQEYKSAKINFIQTSLISFEELKKGNIESAIKMVKIRDKTEKGIYRGWMLNPIQYEQLYTALLERNIELINNPNQYEFCHYLPNRHDAALIINQL